MLYLLVDYILLKIQIQSTSENRTYAGSDFRRLGCLVRSIILFEIFSAKLDHFIKKIISKMV